ncbi:ABC transporter substrate-binding protein [Martelella sp. AMO21009]
MTKETKGGISMNRRSTLKLLGGSVALIGANGLFTLRTAAQEIERGGTLRISVQNRPKDLSPFNSLNNTGFLIAEMLYCGLTRVDRSLQAAPDLAERWDINDTATEFTFHLRPEATFQSGAPVTAADVKASIEAVLSPETGSGSRSTIGPIDRMEIIDDKTIKIVTATPYVDLPVAIGDSRMKIVSAKVLEEQGVEGLYNAADASGPFKLGEFDLDRKIEFLPNENYWDKTFPYVDAVEVLHYPDLNSEALAFQNKEVDAMLETDNANFVVFEQLDGVEPRRQTTSRFYSLTMRFDREPLNNIKVRQALRYTLDREAMVQIVLDGYGRVAYDNILSDDYPYYYQEEKPTRDIEKAKQLLKEAGYEDGVSFTIYTADRPAGRMKVALAIQEMAKAAGFNIDVRRVPYDEYLEKVWKKETAYVASWGMKPTMDAYYTSLMTSDAPWEDTGWHNEEFDALVAEEQQTIDPEKRKELFKKLQELTNRDLPYIIPFYQDYLAANWDYVEDYEMHPLQYTHRLERTWLTEEAPKR